MKITRRQLRRLIRESIGSIEEESPIISPEMVAKLKALIATKDEANEAMAASLIESFYNDLYQLSIIEGDFISVAVKVPKETADMNEDLNDLMTKFNLEFDEFMPHTTLETETANVKDEYKLQSPDHCRVHFKYDDEADYDDGSYDKEPKLSDFAKSRFILDPNRDDEGDYY